MRGGGDARAVVTLPRRVAGEGVRVRRGVGAGGEGCVCVWRQGGAAVRAVRAMQRAAIQRVEGKRAWMGKANETPAACAGSCFALASVCGRAKTGGCGLRR